MTTNPLQLLPRPGVGAPTLVRDHHGVWVCGQQPILFRVGSGEGEVVALERSTRSIPTQHGLGVMRDSWSLVNERGLSVAWLANTDVAAYDADAAARFARAASLTFYDVGYRSAPAPDVPQFGVARLGPGTSPVGAVVAPARQFVLALALLGGLMATWPLIMGTSALPTEGAVGGIASLFLGLGGFVIGPAITMVLGGRLRGRSGAAWFLSLPIAAVFALAALGFWMGAFSVAWSGPLPMAAVMAGCAMIFVAVPPWAQAVAVG